MKTKAPTSAPAADLYMSPLWRARRRYAETSGDAWFILSAKYGLVTPDRILPPYELALSQLAARKRREWGIAAVTALEAEVGDLRGATVEIHAGALYRDACRVPLAEMGATVRNPLDGLSIGQQLAWYRTQEQRDHSPDVEEIIRRLRDRQAALSAADWPADLSDLDHCGLYSWWADVTGARQLSDGLDSKVAPGLIYAGQAGATRWPSGRPSRATLASRIDGNHLRGRVRGSTFRLTLAAALLTKLDLEVVGAKKLSLDSERRLTEWIHDHLAVAVFPYSQPDDLGRLEEAVINRLDPPLNLEGLPSSAPRERLRELRAVIAAGP